MTITIKTTLLAATILAALAAGPAARADEFAGQPSSDVASAALDQQAAGAQLSDPTARGSLRSHGHP